MAAPVLQPSTLMHALKALVVAPPLHVQQPPCQSGTLAYAGLTCVQNFLGLGIPQGLRALQGAAPSPTVLEPSALYGASAPASAQLAAAADGLQVCRWLHCPSATMHVGLACCDEGQHLGALV